MTASSAAERRWRLVAALSGPIVCVVSLVVATAFIQEETGPNIGEAITIGGGLLSYAVAGGLILWHRPRHVVGWILTAVGVVPMLGLFAQEAADRASGGAALVFGLASSLSWVALASGIIVLLVVYPTGRPLSPRWNWVVWLAGIGGVAGAFTDADSYDATFGTGLPEFVFVLATIVFPLLLVAIVAAVVSVAVRFRRGGPRERAQLRLLLAGVVVIAVLLPMTSSESTLSNVLFGLALLVLPAAIATAVVRHQLYDIDRAIKRTFVYALATGVLLAFYAVVVLVAQQVVSGDDRPDVLVAATTLVAAALFRPLATRIQHVLDTRFNRARYDAQRTVAAFGGRLRDQVDLAALRDDLGGVVIATVAPSHASLWLREVSG